MKSIWSKSLVLTATLALHAHALFGLGGHWAPVMGLEVESDRGSITPEGSDRPIELDLEGSSGLQGFGVKFWLDVVPVVDVEVTSNVQFGYYDVSFILDSASTHEVEFDLGIPGVEGKPFFARVYGDAAVLYPFFTLPMLKLHAGGGLSYGMGTQTLDAAFAKGALTRAEESGDFDPATDGSAEITEVLVDAIKDEGMLSGLGLFLQAGTKISPPLIPLAVYGDLKYRFAGYQPDLVGGPDLTLELGAAFAF